MSNLAFYHIVLNYKKLKSYQFIYEGHLHKIEIAENTREKIYVKANVIASMGKKCYQVLIEFSREHDVLRTTCTFCSHQRTTFRVQWLQPSFDNERRDKCHGKYFCQQRPWCRTILGGAWHIFNWSSQSVGHGGLKNVYMLYRYQLTS